MSSASDAPAPSVAGTVFDDEATVLARTYAEALVNVAEKEGQVEEVVNELGAVESDLLGPNPQFAELLASPLLPAAEKDRILVQTLEGRALPAVVRFLRVLNQRGRLGLIGPVAAAARELWDRRQNRRPVTVRSAVPLDGAQQAALRERLVALLGGATPILHPVVDPSLIGGLVVQVGDEVYDASVRNRLEQLRRRLIERKTHEIQSRRDHFRHPA
jgi:F-type H+-transporting ATPase subunit delta